MNLYQINAQIEAIENAVDDGILINEETGEVMTLEQALMELRMAREEKIENVALWVKNLAYDVKTIKAEEETLQKRRKAAEAKMERLKGFLMGALVREDGTAEKFKTARAVVTVCKNNPSTVIDDEALLPAEFWREKIERSPDKTQIKEVLARGIEVPGAHLERSRRVDIK